jgi:serine/threonine protein kinase
MASSATTCARSTAARQAFSCLSNPSPRIRSPAWTRPWAYGTRSAGDLRAVEVSCNSCNRTFILDDKRATKAGVARCVCGARLRINTEKGRKSTGPQRLGKYILQQRIAVGGMGEIYYGKIAGIEGFEREVAIKKMLPHLSEDRNFVDMMIKEAKLTVLLHHPNIVQVYDLSREGNEYYIAMEYVPGVTVGHLLEHSHRTKVHLPYEVAVHITMQVLRGLAYAHDLRSPDGEPMHLLHRDITPQNILVTREAWVKITDFGIAKARNEISTTSPGMIKGKLGYIAPEQLAGQLPDQRVDLFCAAILLWESLATRRLFKGADEIDTFRLISETRVPALSEYRADVPPELEKALRTGLARLPDNRYRTADAFYDALNQAIFPSTADDYADISKKYFANHAELFEAVDRIANDTESAGTDTTELEVPIPDEKLVDVSNLVASTHRQSSLGAVLAFTAALIALVTVLGLWFRADIGKLVQGRNHGGVADPGKSSSGTTTTTTTTANNNNTNPSGNRTLTLQEVQMGVDGAENKFLTCYRQGNAGFRKLESLKARLVIPSTGGVAEVETTPPLAELGKVGPCIESLLRGLEFRSHSASFFEAKIELPTPKKAGAGPVTPAPDAGDRSPLTGADIQGEVKKNSGGILKCIAAFKGDANAPPQIIAAVTISTAGVVTDVDFDPPITNDAVGPCLRKAFKAMKFSKKPKSDVSVRIPLKIQTL